MGSEGSWALAFAAPLLRLHGRTVKGSCQRVQVQTWLGLSPRRWVEACDVPLEGRRASSHRLLCWRLGYLFWV